VVVIHPNGKYAYVSNYGEKTISVISVETHTVIGTIELPFSHPSGFRIHPDGCTAYVTQPANSCISVIDLETFKQKEEPIKIDAEPVGISINPTGTLAYITDRREDSLLVLDLKTRSLLKEKISTWGGLTNVAMCSTLSSNSSYFLRLFKNLKETLHGLSSNMAERN